MQHQFCASLYKKDMDILEQEQQSATPEAGAVMERLQELGVSSLRNRRLPGLLTLVFGYLMEGNIEERARLFSETCTKERRKTSMSCNKGNFFTVRV